MKAKPKVTIERAQLREHYIKCEACGFLRRNRTRDEARHTRREHLKLCPAVVTTW